MIAAKKNVHRKILQDLVPLNALSEARFNEILRKIIIEEVKVGGYLFRSGDRDSQSVYLLGGKVSLLDDKRNVASEIEAGSDASRYPLANHNPRTLTARVLKKAVVARIDSGLLEVFLTWTQSSGAEVVEIEADENEDWMTRLLKSKAYIKIPPVMIQRLLMKMQSFPVKAGEVVISQGDVGDYFYTIHKGECGVTRQDAPDAENQAIATLTDGDSFGEESLVLGEACNATVTMLTDGLLMRLAKEDFIELMQKPLIKHVGPAKAADMVPSGAVLVDVRTPREFALKHIDNSINMPIASIRNNMAELTPNTHYILCSNHDRRGMSAAFILSHRGFNVSVLEGGIDGFSENELVVNHDAAEPLVGADVIPIMSADADRLPETAASSGSIEQDVDAVSLAQYNELEQRYTEACDQLDTLDIKYSALGEECHALHAQAESGNESAALVDQQLADIEALHNKLVASQEALASAEARTSADIEQALELKKQKTAQETEYQEKIEQLDADLQTAAGKLENVSHELGAERESRQQLEEQAQSEQAVLEEQIAGLEASAKAASGQASGVQLLLEKAAAEQEAMRQSAGQAAAEHVHRVDELGKAIEISEREIAGLNERLDEEKKRAKQVGLDYSEKISGYKKEEKVLEKALEKSQKSASKSDSKAAQNLEKKHQLVEEARQELANARREINALQAAALSQSESTDKTRQEIQSTLDEREAVISQLQLDLEGVVADKQALSLKAEELQQESGAQIARVQQELEESQVNLKALTAEVVTHVQQREDHGRQASSRQSEQAERIEGLESELESSQQSYQVASKKLTAYEKKLAGIEQDKTSIEERSTEKQLEHDKSIDSYRSELAQAVEKIDQLGCELEEAGAAIKQEQQSAEALRAEKADVTRSIEKLEKKTQGIDSDKQELENKLQETTERINDLNANLEAGEEAHQKQQGEWNQARSKLEADLADQLIAARSAEESLVSGLEDAADEKRVLEEGRRLSNEQNIANLEQQAVQLAEMKEISQGLSDEAKLIKDEKDELQGLLTESRSAEESLASGLEDAADEKRALEEQHRLSNEQNIANLERQDVRLTEIEESNQKLSDETKVITDERNELQGQLTASRQEADKSQRESEKLKSQINSMSGELDEEVALLQDKLATAEESFIKSSEELSAGEERISSLGEEVQLRTEGQSQAEERVAELTVNLEMVRSETGALVQEKSDEVREAQEELEKLQSDILKKNTVEKTLQSQVDELHQKLTLSADELQAARDDAREEIEKSCQELDALRTTHIAEREEILEQQQQAARELSEIASRHEEYKSSQSTALQDAVEDARQNEDGQISALQNEKSTLEKNVEALKSELEVSHTHAVEQAAETKRRFDDDLALGREQKSEADASRQLTEERLRQMTDERDAVAKEKQSAHEKLKSLRAEVEVARGLINAGADEQVEDAGKLREALDEARRNVEISVRLRAEAERERDQAIEENKDMLNQLKHGMEDDARAIKSPESAPVPVLDAVVKKPHVVAAVKADKKPAAKTPQQKTVNEEISSQQSTGLFDLIAVADKGKKYRWLGASIGLGVVVAMLSVFLMVTQPDDDAVTTVADSYIEDEDIIITEMPVDEVVEQPQLKADPVVSEVESKPEPESDNSLVALGTFRDKLKNGALAPQMIELPAAVFFMGSAGNSMNFDEGPRHKVKMSKFSISQHEITFSDYDRFARATGRRLPFDEDWGRGDQPVINVNWHDASAYAVWLSKQTGKEYRLPSESQWEFAAGAGSEGAYWWGEKASDVEGNCFGCGSKWDNNRTAKVGSFGANTFGLHDTAGNVGEWTDDCYHRGYKGASTDGSPRVIAECSQRVVRGGSYTSPTDSLRTTKRSQYHQDTRLDNLGFRVVRLN